ncbi:MAG: hypothetical protein ACTSUE_22735 [Promethearchaeota archaeon]
MEPEFMDETKEQNVMVEIWPSSGRGKLEAEPVQRVWMKDGKVTNGLGEENLDSKIVAQSDKTVQLNLSLKRVNEPNTIQTTVYVPFVSANPQFEENTSLCFELYANEDVLHSSHHDKATIQIASATFCIQELTSPQKSAQGRIQVSRNFISVSDIRDLGVQKSIRGKVTIQNIRLHTKSQTSQNNHNPIAPMERPFKSLRGMITPDLPPHTRDAELVFTFYAQTEIMDRDSELQDWSVFVEETTEVPFGFGLQYVEDHIPVKRVLLKKLKQISKSKSIPDAIDYENYALASIREQLDYLESRHSFLLSHPESYNENKNKYTREFYQDTLHFVESAIKESKRMVKRSEHNLTILQKSQRETQEFRQQTLRLRESRDLCKTHLYNAQIASFQYQYSTRVYEWKRWKQYRKETASYRSSPLAISTRVFVENEENRFEPSPSNPNKQWAQNYGPPGQYFWKDLGMPSKFRCTDRWLEFQFRIALERFAPEFWTVATSPSQKLTSKWFVETVRNGFQLLEFTPQLRFCCKILVDMVNVFAGSRPYVADARFGSSGQKINTDNYSSIFLTPGDCEDMNTGGMHIMAYIQRHPNFKEGSVLWYLQMLACMYVPQGDTSSAKQAMETRKHVQLMIHLHAMYMSVYQFCRGLPREWNVSLSEFATKLPTPTLQIVYGKAFQNPKIIDQFAAKFPPLIGEATGLITPSYDTPQYQNANVYLKRLVADYEIGTRFGDATDDIFTRIPLGWEDAVVNENGKPRKLKSLQIHEYVTRCYTDWLVYHKLVPNYIVYGFDAVMEDQDLKHKEFIEDEPKRIAVPTREITEMNPGLKWEPLPKLNDIHDKMAIFFENERPPPLLDISPREIAARERFAKSQKDILNKYLGNSAKPSNLVVLHVREHFFNDVQKFGEFLVELGVKYVDIQLDGRNMYRVLGYFEDDDDTNM